MNKYVVYIRWCDDDDIGDEVILVTDNYQRAREVFNDNVAELKSLHPEWTVMDDSILKFFAHGTMPNCHEVKIYQVEAEEDEVPDTNHLNKTQTARLITVARRTWKSLSREEQESYYNDRGTIGFIEDIACILNLHTYKLTLDEFETIHTKVFQEAKR